MRWKLILCAIGVSLWPLVAVSRQTADAGALSAALRTHLQNERFSIVASIRGLPLGVRDALQTLFGSTTLDIAEPGAEFQLNKAAVSSTLPTRRLISAGCSNDFHCLVYYERGGGDRTLHVALFLWTPDTTRFEWGGAAPAGLATIDEVRNAVLSGRIKGGGKIW